MQRQVESYKKKYSNDTFLSHKKQNKKKTKASAH